MALTTGTRLSIGFGLSFVLLVVVATIAVTRLAALNDAFDGVLHKEFQKVAIAQKVKQRVHDNSLATFELFINPDRAALRRRIADNKDGVSQALDELEKLLYLPQGKSLFAAVVERRQAYVTSFTAVDRKIEAGDTGEAGRVMIAETIPALTRLNGAIGELVAFQEKVVADAAEQATGDYRRARTQLLVIALFAGLVSVVAGVLIVRSVIRPLGGEPEQASDIVSRIARGDLSATVPVRSGDRDSLLAHMAEMQGALREMVGNLQSQSSRLSDSANTLSSTSRQVAEATSRQSEAASAMAAAVEQVTVSITHVADRAADAHAATNEAKSHSDHGRKVIEETVDEMEKVSHSVKEAAVTLRTMDQRAAAISGIVQVIKEVADQTNLLALNAAIEAARAGEQGRGFAVVADEVRKLAERTTGATVEISQMIAGVQASATDSVQAMDQAMRKVERGVERASEAGEAMSAIHGSATRVTDAVMDISGALSEQKTASHEVARNVEHIAQMSEENSAAAGETASAAEAVLTSAHAVQDAATRFRL